MDNATGLWNAPLIRRHFLDFECNKILNLPPISQGSTDHLLWHFHSKGTYTVKSGYYVALKRQHATYNQAGSLAGIHLLNQVLSQIWSAPILPRIKHFLWRALHDTLPTSFNLHKRSLADATCLACGLEEETINHLFHHCHIPTAIAAVDSRSSKWLGQHATSLLELLKNILDTEGLEGLSMFANLLWQIWKTRCSFIFEGCRVRALTVVAKAEAISEEYIEACGKKGREAVARRCEIKWNPPDFGSVKVNVDGSMRNGIFALGGIIRDCSGKILVAFSQPALGTIDVEYLELLAINEGLIQAHNGRFAALTLESDCMAAVQRILSCDDDLSPHGTLAARIRSLAFCFSTVNFVHIHREGNVPAHLLARHGLELRSKIEWNQNFPQDVLAGSTADLL